MSQMDADLAQDCLRRLICTVLRRSGFDASSPDALAELEDKVLVLIGGLLHMAQQYAELARRTRPTTTDLLEACDDGGIGFRGLVDTLRLNASEPRTELDTIHLTNAEAVEEGSTIINNIDEASGQPLPDSSNTRIFDSKLRKFLPDSPDDVDRHAPYAPDFLPSLPPSHSYKTTPTYPSIATAQQAIAAGVTYIDPITGKVVRKEDLIGDAANPSTTADKRITQLDARIKTTRLVEASLQNLIRATSKAGSSSLGGGGAGGAGDKHQQEEEAEQQQREEEAGSLLLSLPLDINSGSSSSSTSGSAAAKKKRSETVRRLLKKFEEDAAVCNFEIEWYGPGGTAGKSGGGAAAAAAGQVTGSSSEGNKDPSGATGDFSTGHSAASGQLAAQRKRGRWKY